MNQITCTCMHHRYAPYQDGLILGRGCSLTGLQTMITPSLGGVIIVMLESAGALVTVTVMAAGCMFTTASTNIGQY